jgi:ABC-type siderophore export system fused ATPase/permease subunit
MPNFAMLLTFVFYTKVLGETLEPATAFVAITVFLNVRSGLDALPGAIDAVLTCKIALDRLKGFLNQPEVKFESENISGGHIIMDNATVSWPSGDGEGGPRAFRLTGLNFSLPVGAMTLVCGPLGSGKTLFVGLALVDHL